MTTQEQTYSLAESAVATLLKVCGYDPTENGLIDTPARVVRALVELTSGEWEDPAVHLERVFDSGDTDEMIIVRDVGFASMCEHHMLPFVGKASVAYIPAPGAPIVGLSKLARVVDVYARRLQVQERMTAQIAGCIDKHLTNVGVAVTISAHHTCMSLRGVRKEGADMVTSKLLGLFKTDASARAEFFGHVA